MTVKMDPGPIIRASGHKKKKKIQKSNDNDQHMFKDKKRKVIDVELDSIKKNKHAKAEHKLLERNDEVEKRSLGEKRISSADAWVISVVSGVNLTSKELVVSSDGKHIFVNSGDKVVVYSTSSGQMVRQLNTGPIISIQKGNQEGELIVATLKKLCIWNFMDVRIVNKFKIECRNKLQSFEKVDIYIPETFNDNKEIFLGLKKDSKVSLFRLNLETNESAKIFNDFKVGTLHLGAKDQLVCAISDHKEHGFKDCTLLMYDRNLSKVMTLHTDKNRPYTCVKVHPSEKVVACGDTSGRILVYSGLEQQTPSKSILHWHSLPVGGLCWSDEGGLLYSGGGEAVLVKWKQEDGSKPYFVPRIGGSIIGISGGGGFTVLQLDSNRLVVIDRTSDTVTALVGGLAKNKKGWPAGICKNMSKLLMNGACGMVQVYDTSTGQVQSIDITQQTQLTVERNAAPHNNEVEKMAISSCGQYLATVDCMWANITRVTLKLWTWSAALNNFTLNTQVDTPHQAGVNLLSFQPSHSADIPMLLSLGGDQAKLWELKSNWSCASCMSFRHFPTGAGGWSSDGTVVGVAFGHIVTLWDSNSNLKATLHVEDDFDAVNNIVFGTNRVVRHIYASTSSKVIVWDLLTMSLSWTFSLTPSLCTSLHISPSASLLAIVQKDVVTMLDPLSKTVVKMFHNTNFTGGAAWIPKGHSSECLYLLTYEGQLTRIGPPVKSVRNTPIQPQKSVFQTLLSKNEKRSLISDANNSLLTRSKTMHDIDSMLSLPLYTVPPPSQMRNILVKNRLIALPKLRRSKPVDNTEKSEDEEKQKIMSKINNAFSFEQQESELLDLKSFCKLLKKSSL